MKPQFGYAIIAALISLGVCSAPAIAQGIDATGVYTGTSTELITCTDGSSGVRNLNTTMTVSGDSSGAFSASTFFDGTQTFNGVTTPFSNQAAPFVGTVAADGSLVAQFQATPPINATGSLVGDTMSFTNSSVFGICTFDQTTTVVRNSVNPAKAQSSLITGSANLLSSTRAISSLQRIRVRNVASGNAVGANEAMGGFMLQGLAAGDGGGIPVGGWLSFFRTDSKNNFSSTAFESERITLLGGIDASPRDWLVTGLALGYEDAEVETQFNRGELKTDGVTISPYVAFLLSDRLYLDATVGVSVLDTEQFRIETNSNGSTTTISSDVGALRRFFTANANYGMEYGDWLINMSVGYLWAHQRQDDHVESNGAAVSEVDFRLSQLRLGGDLTYRQGNWEPYGRLMFERDLSVTEVRVAGGFGQPEQDEAGVNAGIGLRYFPTRSISTQVELNSVLGRNNLREHTWSFMVRGDF